MADNTPKCLVCERTGQQIPLLTLNYRDQQIFICPQHLPVLIHHPDELIGRLPGAEKFEPYQQ
ncbi:MAG TPA: hypothetical protein VIO61_04710 [Anaerolineaceae bacterium]